MNLLIEFIELKLENIAFENKAFFNINIDYLECILNNDLDHYLITIEKGIYGKDLNLKDRNDILKENEEILFSLEIFLLNYFEEITFYKFSQIGEYFPINIKECNNIIEVI
jgi:hypothetical protein